MEGTGTVVRTARKIVAVRIHRDRRRGEERVVLCAVGGRLFESPESRHTGRNAVVAGDEVAVEGVPEDGPEPALGRIARVLPRRNELRRGVGPQERRATRVFAANLDRFLIVSAFREPPYRAGFLDRSLVVAYAAGVRPALVFNKRDLADEADAERLYRELASYRSLDLDIHLMSALRGDGIEEFRSWLAGGRSVLFGHSGVGKTELLAALGVPGRRRGRLDRRGRGRHTTTGAEVIALPGGGEIVDTPGVRALGIDGLTPEQVRAAHPDLSRHADGCRFSGCSHRTEPGCAVKTAVAEGRENESRYRSLIRLTAEAAGLAEETAPWAGDPSAASE